jgi:circadian clock protein KaiC
MYPQSNNRISTGITGLDQILHGGLPPRHAYLVRGDAGTGKTTLGLHFLVEGVKHNENVLFISLQQNEESIRENALKIGINTEGIHFLDLSPPPEFFAKAERFELFTIGQIDNQPITKSIVETIEKLRPARVFIDPVTLFRYLSPDQFHFRKQVLSLLAFLSQKNVTVLLSNEISSEIRDDDLRACVSGIIRLEHFPGERCICIEKVHGSDFIDGPNSFKITSCGMEVFPRLIAGNFYKQRNEIELLTSGNNEIDNLLKGGIEKGTITLISGPSGAGKTSLAVQFLISSSSIGKRAVMYSFEEESDTLRHRIVSSNNSTKNMMENGMLDITKIEPFQFSPDEFTSQIQKDVNDKKTQVILIDSLTGYNSAVNQKCLVQNLHTIGSYLRNMKVSLFIITETSHVIESTAMSDIGVSYFSDNIIFLRYLEYRGELRKVIGVLKKRSGDFEKTLRLFEITAHGVKVGKPLKNLRGILTGIPEILSNIPDDEIL